MWEENGFIFLAAFWGERKKKKLLDHSLLSTLSIRARRTAVQVGESGRVLISPAGPILRSWASSHSSFQKQLALGIEKVTVTSFCSLIRFEPFPSPKTAK